MSPMPEAKTGAPNIQDVFLNQARRDRIAVTVCLLDGRQFEGRIKNFDKYAVVVEVADGLSNFRNGICSAPRRAFDCVCDAAYAGFSSCVFF